MYLKDIFITLIGVNYNCFFCVFYCVKGLELIVDQPMHNYNIVLVRQC